MQEFENIWELYGLKSNPFSTSPLLVMGGLIPITSFHGRSDEVKRLKRNISSEGGSRTLVCGDIGVGKTSFVNYVRYLAHKTGFFTPFKEIAVQENWTSEMFILNTLSAIESTIGLISDNPLSSEKYNKLKSIVNLYDNSISGGGFNISAIGVNLSTSINKGISTNYALQTFFNEVVSDIKSKTGKDIIIHYNNLERLNEDKIISLFEDLRDFFQISNVHFIFVGNLVVQSYIAKMPRFNSILSDTPIIINTLSYDDVWEIIEKRIQDLKINDLTPINPFNRDALSLLYHLYDGNIRNILNSLSTAVSEATRETGVRFNKELLAITLKNIAEKRYFDKLSQNERRILMIILEHDEITIKKIIEYTKMAQPNISKYMKKLVEVGSINLRRIEGRDKYWCAQADIKWYSLATTNKLDSLKDKQKRLNF